MDEIFDDAWRKWAWATCHAHALCSDIGKLSPHHKGQSLYAFRSEYEPNRHAVVSRVTHLAVFPSRWGIRLGDVVHNYSSALDYVAWALVKRGKTPSLTDQAAKQVYFPIADTPTKFKGWLGQKLPGVRRADVAVVRRYQPYRNGKRAPHLHPFAILRDLSSFDKHREIQPTWSVPESVKGYEIREVVDCTISRLPTALAREPLDIGTELHRVYVRKTGPHPKVDVQIDLMCHPCLGNGVPIVLWIQAVRDLMASLLHELAPPPLDELRELGIALRYPSDGTIYVGLLDPLPVDPPLGGWAFDG